VEKWRKNFNASIAQILFNTLTTCCASNLERAQRNRRAYSQAWWIQSRTEWNLHL